jgi:hypothetical protein
VHWCRFICLINSLVLYLVICIKHITWKKYYWLRDRRWEETLWWNSVKHSSQHIIYLYIENGSFIVGQISDCSSAETILIFIWFLGKNPSDSKHCEDERIREKLMSCIENTSNLQCLFVLWLKALQVYLLWFPLGTCLLATAMCDEHNGEILKYQKPLLIEGRYYISVERYLI